MALTYNEKIIKSVLGFNFDVKVTYTDEQGKEVVIEPKARMIPYLGKEKANVGSNCICRKFFTNFDEGLLQKIRDYQNKNF